MKKFNTKVQMLDAGMVMFESRNNFGPAMGQVKAEMEAYGKVLKSSELSDVVLPESTGECDLFLDWSTPWRIRYISCHLESAGIISSRPESVSKADGGNVHSDDSARSIAGSDVHSEAASVIEANNEDSDSEKVLDSSEKEEVFRYAASFREGNKSTVLRSVCMAAIMAAALISVFCFHTILATLAATVIIGIIAYNWIRPSNRAIRTVREIMHTLSLYQKFDSHSASL